MTEVHLRPATVLDAARMVEIEIAAATIFPPDVLPEAVGRTGSPQEIARGIEAGLAWAAEIHRGPVVGFLVARIIETSMHIVEMDVLPSHSRQGIGGQLLRHAVAQCNFMGLRDVTLTTFRTVPWNAPFYARHGFQIEHSVFRRPHLVRAIHEEAQRGLNDRVAMYRDAA